NGRPKPPVLLAAFLTASRSTGCQSQLLAATPIALPAAGAAAPPHLRALRSAARDPVAAAAGPRCLGAADRCRGLACPAASAARHRGLVDPVVAVEFRGPRARPADAARWLRDLGCQAAGLAEPAVGLAADRAADPVAGLGAD